MTKSKKLAPRKARKSYQKHARGKRRVTLNFYVLPEEAKKIRARAEKLAGGNMSAMLRRMGLGLSVRAST